MIITTTTIMTSIMTIITHLDKEESILARGNILEVGQITGQRILSQNPTRNTASPHTEGRRHQQQQQQQRRKRRYQPQLKQQRQRQKQQQNCPQQRQQQSCQPQRQPRRCPPPPPLRRLRSRLLS